MELVRLTAEMRNDARLEKNLHGEFHTLSANRTIRRGVPSRDLLGRPSSGLRPPSPIGWEKGLYFFTCTRGGRAVALDPGLLSVALSGLGFGRDFWW